MVLSSMNAVDSVRILHRRMIVEPWCCREDVPSLVRDRVDEPDSSESVGLSLSDPLMHSLNDRLRSLLLEPAVHHSGVELMVHSSGIGIEREVPAPHSLLQLLVAERIAAVRSSTCTGVSTPRNRERDAMFESVVSRSILLEEDAEVEHWTCY